MRIACVLASAATCCFAVASWASAAADRPEDGTFQVFILAGQSNMEGQAVVDLRGKDYNGGRGTLEALAGDPATAVLVAHLRAPDGSWRTRDDVFMRYTPEGRPARTGPLGIGFTPHQGLHHFGPELQIGTVLGDAIDEPVLLVKTAWGGKSLFKDFRPPSSGGELGPYYRRMVDDVRAALAKAGDEIPALRGLRPKLAGLVWYQGWNDGCDPKRAVPEYEQNLVNLVTDLRRDLSAPSMPVAIGELTGPWRVAPGEWARLRAAQSAAARRPEVRGTGERPLALFVPTAAFVRAPEDSPNPGHGHHEFGNAETYVLVGDALGRAMRALAVEGAPEFEPTLPGTAGGAPSDAELSGYMIVPTERVPDEFNAGFSLYAAAWPLMERHPGNRFQSGLFGTWMFAQFARGADGKPDPADKPKDMYSDIEGGLGWWRDTRFPTTVPKFIMGGVAPDFRAWANGPGAGKGRDWNRPAGKYAIAQLSPWVAWPPDGLNLAQGTCGELFGYGYLPLPLVDARPADGAGRPVTGGQCWTLFLNTANFKGPVAFFVPGFWSEAIDERPELVGKLLDTRPSDPNKAFQMETQWIPAAMSSATTDGSTYARVAPMSFPVDAQGRTVVLHRLTSYSRAALPDAVQAWFAGGSAPSGAFDPAAAHVQRFGRGGASTWKIFAEGTDRKDRMEVDWKAFGSPIAHDPETFGFQWNQSLVRTDDDGRGARVRMPEHFRLAGDAGAREAGKAEPRRRWTAIDATDVPAETQLASLRLEPPPEKPEGPYVTPDEPKSPFLSPGPASGPVEATLGDGSTITYRWYRFCDQPAIIAAGLGDAERAELQRRVELIHRAWTKEREYIPPPTTGSPASLDPALVVTPPPGLEVGYVPIVVRQERK